MTMKKLDSSDNLDSSEKASNPRAEPRGIRPEANKKHSPNGMPPTKNKRGTYKKKKYKDPRRLSAEYNDGKYSDWMSGHLASSYD